METSRYTITIFAENNVGLLNQITILLTRLGLNIETLTVAPSPLHGIHKLIVTTDCTQDLIRRAVKQIDKKIDVIKVYYNIDEELVQQEIALYKVPTSKLLAMGDTADLMRRYSAGILDMTEEWVIIQKTGHSDTIEALLNELKDTIGVLQFVRAEVVITKSDPTKVDNMFIHKLI